MDFKKLLRSCLSLLIIGTVLFFFYRQFQLNWSSIESSRLTPSLPFIALSMLAILANCLLNTYSWFFTVNALSSGARITLAQSVATCNTSNLTKYVPGKVWSYALQSYWLARKGFSGSLILYVYLLNTFVSLMSFMLLGVAFLLLSPARPLPLHPFALLVLLLAADLCFLRYNAPLFGWLISRLRGKWRVEVAYFETSTRLMLKLHAIYLLGGFCLGAGAYLMCFGIGFDVDGKGAFPVMAAMMISDVLGFLAVIVPGGLGVREGIMFTLLTGVSTQALSLMLPIATRIANMLVDVSLGVVGFILLKKVCEPQK